MKKLLLSAFILLLLPQLVTSTPHGTNPTLENIEKAKGGKYYGGIMRINEPEYINNLFPHSIVDIVSERVATNLYEGLFKLDVSTLEVKPNLCEKYEVSEDGLTYSFTIKPGVFFHDDACFPKGKGRELTAKDFEYCFTLLFTQSKNNFGHSVFVDAIKGARKYYNASANGKVKFKIDGITAKDKYTFQIELTKPSSLLLMNLTRPSSYVFPKEAFEKYGEEMRFKAVGTGPFVLSQIEKDVSIQLKKNKNYHGMDEFGNKLPFLDGITIQFIKDKLTELEEFKNGNLDMLYRLPTESIIDILESAHSEDGGHNDYEVQRDPEMKTHILGFNFQDPIFKNKDVRKAFSFAIDREKILDFILNGEGYEPGFYGLVPPTFKSYNVKKVKGYQLNTDSAKFYMNRAGYPEGAGFPKVTLDLNASAGRKTQVAMEVQKQLKDVLNIDIELSIHPLAEHVEKIEMGNSSFFSIAWGADIPAAQNFLSMLYGKEVPDKIGVASFPNIMRYKNPKYDALYEKGIEAKDIYEANEYFMQADNLALKDAPYIVLWYDEGYRLLISNVKDCPNNPMQYRDFSIVYFEPK